VRTSEIRPARQMWTVQPGDKGYVDTAMAEFQEVADILNVELADELLRTSKYPGRSLYEVDYHRWVMRLELTAGLKWSEVRWARRDRGLGMTRAS
jgi:hypothetical protein